MMNICLIWLESVIINVILNFVRTGAAMAFVVSEAFVKITMAATPDLGCVRSAAGCRPYISRENQ